MAGVNRKCPERTLWGASDAADAMPRGTPPVLMCPAILGDLGSLDSVLNHDHKIGGMPSGIGFMGA